VRALLAFFTALPNAAPGSSLEDAAHKAYLLPLVGFVVGLPGAALLLLSYAMPSGVAATLALGVVLLTAGLHHTDGVMDVGDALMVRGSPERRREVLKDARLGVGGIGALFVVYSPTLAALVAFAEASPTRAALALLAGEVSARSGMFLTLSFGRPVEAGSSSVPFVQALKGSRKMVGVTLALLAPLLLVMPLGSFAPLAILSVPLTTLAALWWSKKAFGGIGGDVVGATGEACRMMLLVALSVT
jgi:adenosylcobinamide-GDP ribazoletransferase